MSQNNRNKKKSGGKMESYKQWMIGTLITVFIVCGGVIYRYGVLNQEVVELKKDVASNTTKIELVNEKISSAMQQFNGHFNSILISLGDIKADGMVTTTQLKTVRAEVKELKEDVRRLIR